MIFRIVPKLTAKLLLLPRRRAPTSFLWGLGLGAVAGIVRAAGVVQRLAQGAAAPRPAQVADGAQAVRPAAEPGAGVQPS